MIKLLAYYICIGVALFISLNSCNRSECNNTNPIFNKFSPDTEEYKTELAKQIKNIGIQDVTYWFDKYLKRGDREYIVVKIQGKELCAKGEIRVTDWSKLIGLKRDINGFRGAELKGLHFEIVKDSSDTDLIYKSIDRIID